MEYLKFNCYDLAAQSTELYGIYSKIQQLSNELDEIINSLDPQIKSYTDLQKQFTASQTVMADIVARFLSSYNTLEQITDIYYAAENKVLQASESLPMDIPIKGSSKNSNAVPITSSSAINNNDLILEDWLAELIYKNNSDKN